MVVGFVVNLIRNGCTILLITMLTCGHVWKMMWSEGEWCGYGVEAEQYTAVWYECKLCGATSFHSPSKRYLEEMIE